MLQIKLRRNPEYSKHSMEKTTPRYFFELGLSRVIEGGGQATLPVYWRPNTSPHPMLKEIYSVEVAGIMVEKANILAVEKALPDAVQSLANYGTLPYYFIDIPGRARIPVYLVDGKLQTRVGDDAQLEEDDVGQLWHALGDYLIPTRVTNSREEVTVSLLFWKELRIYPPAFIFRNGKGKIWIPIFYRGERLNYDVIGQPSRLLPISEAFNLREEVAAGLTASKMLSSPFELRMDQVQREIWDRLEKTVAPTDRVLSYYEETTRTELPIFEVRGGLLVPQVTSTVKINFGRDIEDLLKRAAEELIRERKISSASYVEIRTKGR
jgi:hypothetical protein